MSRGAGGAGFEAAVKRALAREAAARAAQRSPLGGPETGRAPRSPVGSPAAPGRAEGSEDAHARASGSGKSALVEALVRAIEAEGLPPPRWAGSPGGELRPIPGRRYRLDLAWEAERVYAEVDGGAWVGGRHGRGAGILTDCEKTSLLAGLGWRHVRVTVQHRKIQAGAVGWVRAALAYGVSGPTHRSASDRAMSPGSVESSESCGTRSTPPAR